MKVPVNSIRAGNVIEYNGKLWVASKVQHISPGKGGAFVAIEAKALREGNKLQERFRSGETIEHVHIDERDCTYLFKDDNGFTFMDKENYEQLTVGADVLDPEQSRWLQDGMEVTVSLYEGSPVGVELPKNVVLAVTEADAVVKGQTASSSYKPAILDNGVRVMVPPHISAGTRIVVDVYEQTYVRRAD
jgi:elongation factor P